MKNDFITVSIPKIGLNTLNIVLTNNSVTSITITNSFSDWFSAKSSSIADFIGDPITIAEFVSGSDSRMNIIKAALHELFLFRNSASSILNDYQSQLDTKSGE